MSKPSLLLVGAGGHARASIDVIELEDRFAIAGLLGLPAEVGTRVLGYPVIGTDDDLPELARKVGNALVTVGQIRTPSPRVRLYERLKALGAGLPVIVAPTAHVSRHATIGEGTVVMHGAMVNAGARLGANGIVNSQALIEHDARIEVHCHIATGARINGGAVVGAGCFVGSGAILGEGVRIGPNSVIGAGRVVLRDLPPGTLLRGEP